MCRALLAVGADPNKGSDSKSPLHLAAATGQDDFVRMLLDAGAETETQDSRRWTPLLRASCTGHANIVHMLLAEGADYDAREPEDMRTPLLMAAAQGHAGIVKALLDEGACHTARDRYGESSVYVAADANHADILRELIVTRYTLNLEP